MICYKYHRDMDVPHYVLVDVSANYPLHGMIFYKYHRDMDAPHYVCDDVPSNDCA